MRPCIAWLAVVLPVACDHGAHTDDGQRQDERTAFHPDPTPLTIVRSCWTSGEAGAVEGSYSVRLTIDASGQTTGATVTSLDSSHTPCVQGQVSHWRYPLAGGGVVALPVRWRAGRAEVGAPETSEH
jgi:hypothetical protein